MVTVHDNITARGGALVDWNSLDTGYLVASENLLSSVFSSNFIQRFLFFWHVLDYLRNRADAYVFGRLSCSHFSPSHRLYDLRVKIIEVDGIVLLQNLTDVEQFQDLDFMFDLE